MFLDIKVEDAEIERLSAKVLRQCIDSIEKQNTKMAVNAILSHVKSRIGREVNKALRKKMPPRAKKAAWDKPDLFTKAGVRERFFAYRDMILREVIVESTNWLEDAVKEIIDVRLEKEIQKEIDKRQKEISERITENLRTGAKFNIEMDDRKKRERELEALLESQGKK